MILLLGIPLLVGCCGGFAKQDAPGSEPDANRIEESGHPVAGKVT
jgi:hypothetical protein